jgi:hypothetical protein
VDEPTEFDLYLTELDGPRLDGQRVAAFYRQLIEDMPVSAAVCLTESWMVENVFVGRCIEEDEDE